MQGASSLRVLPLISVLFSVIAMAMVDPSLALTLGPGVALLAVLLSGRTPCEALIARLEARRRPATRRRLPPVERWSPAPLIAHRTGRLIAFALAMRPPPAHPA